MSGEKARQLAFDQGLVDSFEVGGERRVRLTRLGEEVYLALAILAAPHVREIASREEPTT